MHVSRANRPRLSWFCKTYLMQFEANKRQLGLLKINALIIDSFSNGSPDFVRIGKIAVRDRVLPTVLFLVIRAQKYMRTIYNGCEVGRLSLTPRFSESDFFSAPAEAGC